MKYNLEWVIQKYDRNGDLKFIFFWGHTPGKDGVPGPFVFSQWYPAPFIIEDVVYFSSEHWMMAQKALLFDNLGLFNRIIKEEKPAVVKALGRQIQGFDQQKWDEQKFNIVVNGNVEKFRQNEILKRYLHQTNDRIIVEASPTDTVWGIGLQKDSPGINNPHTWQGQNLLGFAIMEARDLIRG